MKTNSNINLLLMGLIVFTFITVNSSAQLNWDKYEGNPIIEGSLPEWDVSKWYPVMIHEDGLFKMWYCGWNWQTLTHQIGYGVSEDGINWSLNDDPVIPSGNWGAWDYWRMPGTVLRINDTLRMWYGGSTYSWGTMQIGYAWAVEENNWNVLPEPILEKGEPGTWDYLHVLNPCVYFDGAMYHMYYTACGSEAFQIGYATSNDGIHWSKDYINSPVISLGEDGTFYDEWVMASGLVVYNDTIRMFFTGNDGTTTYPPEYSYFRVGYAWSTDYVNWTVGNNMEPVVDVGAVGSWDERWVRAPWVMVHDGRLKMWYTGYTFYEPVKIGYALGDFITGLPHIIHVPGDYPTIQQGIDAANNGDTVLVSDGTYYEQINFLGKKPLTVASEFLMDGDTNHIASTIIDGSQLTNLDSASVVYFVSGEDTTSILCGFTVRNGKGTYTTDNNSDRQGGGIWISNAGAKIIHNRITHNTVDDTQPGNGASTSGGGIGAKYGFGNYWIVIADNTIDSNSCNSTYEYATGGGIALSYNTRIFKNIISHNNASGYQNANVWGGGMYIATNGGNCRAIIEENSITNNSTQGAGIAASAGGNCDNMKTTFSNNLVANNTANPGEDSGGAGFGLYLPKAGSVVSGNIFRENVISDGIGGAMLVQGNSATNTVIVENNYFINNWSPSGGGFSMLSNPVLLQNNVFIGNQAENEGGAVWLIDYLNLQFEHLAILINNSFYNNAASNKGGAIYSDLAKPLIFNSIFWNDSAANGSEIYSNLPTDTVEIGFSAIDLNAIQGGYTIDGSGNINEDPLFEDLELLTLSSASPCINSGIDEYICHCGDLHLAPGYDILGNLRPLNDYYEMGAYEYPLPGIGEPLTHKINDWHSVYPNPFTDQAKLSYELDNKTQVEITLYSISGELIQTLLSEQQEAGNHELQFSSGNLPAGIYFYRITTDLKQATGRMILMK
jgi:predicted GH43/DUF377 family glycosyl hydrolase